MRKFKRLASLALAAVMTLGMCAPAFAVEGDQGDGTQTPEEKYDVFQIFTGTYANMDGDTLGDIKWGSNGKYIPEGETENQAVAGQSVPTDVLNELVALGESSSDKARLDVITKYVDFTIPVQANKTLDELKDIDEGANGWANGYYLVRPVGSDNNVESNEYVPYVVTVVDNKLNLNPKKGVPTVDKTVVKGTEEEKKGAASIGDMLNFKIVGTLPDNLADYKSYYYTFTDIMSKGLEFDKETVKITIEGKGILKENQFYVGSEKGANDTTVITIGVNDLKAAVENLSASDKVVVTYSAELTDKAYVGKDPNTNEVKLTYSNDPRKNGEGKPNDPDNKPDPTDPEDPKGETVTGEKGKTETYVTGLTVTDFADGKPMTDAAFTLTGDGINSKLTVTTSFVEVGEGETGVYYKLTDDTYTTEAPTEETKDQYADYEEGMKPGYKVGLFEVSEATGVDGNKKSVKATIDANGSLTITGLSTGQYTLHQDSAPAGYNVHHDIVFTVGFNNGNFDKAEAPEGGKANDHDDEVKVADNWFYVHINQGRGALLPETGGVGTMMMYIGGMLLIAMAGATIILKGKKAEDAE